MIPSHTEGLTVPSEVEGLMVLSAVEGLVSSPLMAEKLDQCLKAEGQRPRCYCPKETLRI